MLRSRTKPDEAPKQPYGFSLNDLDVDVDVENLELSNSKGSGSPSRLWRRLPSVLPSKMRICFVMILFLVLIGFDRLRRWRVVREASLTFGTPVAPDPYPPLPTAKQTDPRNSAQDKGDHLFQIWNPTWRYPLVDRVALQELVDDVSFNSSHDRAQWQPRVTRLPEDDVASRSRSGNENNSRSTKVSKPSEAICETPTHPRPCRFLFPVRVAEQESKARIHFFQLAQLARRLNRTLVLPKVGKSKIGACFKWTFETYYDLDSLNASLDDPLAVIDQEDFQVWLDELEPRGHPTPRFFSVGPSLVSQLTVPEEPSSPKDTRIRVYESEPYDGWRIELPGCLSKSRWLDGIYPTFMTVAQSTRAGQSNLLSESMLAALSDESLSKKNGDPVTAPQILVLDWNLRYPVFPPSSIQQLQYSPKLVSLAKQLAPSTSYLAVHWRMETIDPGVLIDCAHALVDLLVRLLHDELIADNVTTVWFASDYPYPIAPRTKTQPRPALEAKSGTFREFEIRHEQAVQVLRMAFEEGGELDRWKVTDIPEALESHVVDKELVNDAGVLGIVDKLIGIQANLFVSGSNRCARRSSFTTQIVDGRMSTRRREDLVLGNIVDTFG